MSDIRCRQCGEPWDLDSIHDLVAEAHDRSEWTINGNYVQEKYDPLFKEAMEKFRKEGCRAFGSSHGELLPPSQAATLSMIDDVLGDDVDGVIAMEEDAQLFGLI